MKNNWYCPLCGYSEWMKKRTKVWSLKKFHKRNLLTCKKCCGSSMYPMPTKEELDEINKNYWTIYAINSFDPNGVPKIQAFSRINYLKNSLENNQFKNILDVGSGFGNFLEALHEINIKFLNYTAIEPDDSMEEILYSNKASKVLSSIEKLIKKDFSLVVMSHILEHLANPIEYLNKIKNHMIDKGILFIEVPNQDHLIKKDLGLHTLVFNLKSLRNLLIKTKFKIIDITTCGYPISNLIPKRGFYYLLREKVYNLIPKLIQKIKIHLNKSNLLKRILFSSKVFKEEYDGEPISSLMLDEYGKGRLYIRTIVQK